MTSLRDTDLREKGMSMSCFDRAFGGAGALLVGDPTCGTATADRVPDVDAISATLIGADVGPYSPLFLCR